MILIIIISSLFCLFLLQPTLVTDLGYYTRPIWDKRPNVFTTIPHYYAENVPMEDLCQLHGWKLKDKTTLNQTKVYDAIIFSTEIDLLHIRIRELWNVVDTFVILESNATFTGKPKNLTFDQHKDQFEFAASKIHHVMIDQYALPPGEGPFYNERTMRIAMDQALIDAGVKTGDIVVMSDVDEIIRNKSLWMLKMCEGVPNKLHLQLRNYLYSFEFFLDMESWRAHVVQYVEGQTFYSHGQITEYLLADAGWHCSFCFRTLKEFQFKMQSYSHSDRVRHEGILKPNRIQKTICDGTDIFDMPPESYTYRDMISKLGAMKSTKSGVGLPSAILTDAEKYKFLLPGGCIREDFDD
ncbi:glycosyl transferase-like protein [Gilbertella persicaria]|uniref:glycosyl transferase-like protein n=1 Tax=Gilbertella persicaria TaxID=101096 RepID=UPI00221F71CF|nr:glycosyl transferase-like protein [Gilbertella persicaria]KAI8079605.1 glycosyl transferase-like protein [Gilbertella persicaria]